MSTNVPHIGNAFHPGRTHPRNSEVVEHRRHIYTAQIIPRKANIIPHTREAGDDYQFGNVYEKSEIGSNQPWDIDAYIQPHPVVMVG